MQMRTWMVLWGVLIAIAVTTSRASAQRVTDDIEIRREAKRRADPSAVPELQDVIGTQHSTLEQRRPIEPIFSWTAMFATVGTALVITIVLVSSRPSKVDV